MERYASTLATSAACLGLFVAGHIALVQARPALPDMDAIRAQHIARIAAATQDAAVSEPVRSWDNPPAKAEPAAADATATAIVAAPAPVQAAQAAPLAEPAAPVQHVALSEKPKRAVEPAQKRRSAKLRKMQVASRSLANDGTTAGPSSAAPAAPAPSQPSSQRIDPIGDILRGLGIGRES